MTYEWQKQALYPSENDVLGQPNVPRNRFGLMKSSALQVRIGKPLLVLRGRLNIHRMVKTIGGNVYITETTLNYLTLHFHNA